MTLAYREKCSYERSGNGPLSFCQFPRRLPPQAAAARYTFRSPMICRSYLFRGLVLAVLALCACVVGFAQDAPQPQPVPGLSTQPPRATTTPSKPQQQPSAPVAPAPEPAPASPPSTPDKPTQTKVIPAGAERHFHEAMVFERDGDAENAIEEYKAAIKEYPDYFEAHYNLGHLYLDRHGYSEAIAELKTTINLRPDNAAAHFALGLALKDNHDLNGAVAEYQEAIRLNPQLTGPHNNLANVLYMKRDFNGAIQQYRDALALEPKNSDKLSQQARTDLANTHTNLGSALDDAGRPDEAIAEYKIALQLAPRDAKTHYNFAIFYQKHKDIPNAVSELRIAAKIAPDWPTPHIMLARLLKDSDPKAAFDQCIIADGLTEDAKLHNLCSELQRKTQ